MDTGKVLLGALAGVVVGAALGILFAPAKFVKTRKRIFKKGKFYVDEIGIKYNELTDEIAKQFETAKEEVVRAGEKGVSKVNGL